MNTFECANASAIQVDRERGVGRDGQDWRPLSPSRGDNSSTATELQSQERIDAPCVRWHHQVGFAVDRHEVVERSQNVGAEQQHFVFRSAGPGQNVLFAVSFGQSSPNRCLRSGVPKPSPKQSALGNRIEVHRRGVEDGAGIGRRQDDGQSNLVAVAQELAGPDSKLVQRKIVERFLVLIIPDGTDRKAIVETLKQAGRRKRLDPPRVFSEQLEHLNRVGGGGDASADLISDSEFRNQRSRQGDLRLNAEMGVGTEILWLFGTVQSRERMSARRSATFAVKGSSGQVPAIAKRSLEMAESEIA